MWVSQLQMIAEKQKYGRVLHLDYLIGVLKFSLCFKEVETGNCRWWVMNVAFEENSGELLSVF